MAGNHSMTQYTVALRNQPGALRGVAQALAKADVNVLGATGEVSGGLLLVRFIADKTAEARRALDGLGLAATQDAVFRVQLPHKPGALAQVTKALEDAGVCVTSVYGTADDGERCRLVLAVDKPEKAEKALAAFADTLVLATH